MYAQPLLHGYSAQYGIGRRLKGYQQGIAYRFDQRTLVVAEHRIKQTLMIVEQLFQCLSAGV
jgi:hypothetical protein